MSKKALRINVGCGEKKIHGFVNVDIRGDVEPDVVCDVKELHHHFKFADLVYACHVLEHFRPSEIDSVLNSWKNALKTGGILRLSVPNFDAICRRYLYAGDIAELQGLICGGNKNEFDHHFIAFDFKSLEARLLRLGFEKVRLWDWQHVDHRHTDDYSQAYLPHMQKVDGMMMSLNIEAERAR